VPPSEQLLPFPTLEQRAAFTDALRGAAIVPGSEQVLDTQGKSGAPTKLLLQTAGGRIEAITKPHNGGELRGLLAQDIAVQLGIGHLVPPLAVRDDRTITMFVHAKEGRKVGVDDAASLEATITTWYEHTQPTMPAAERAVAARRDTQLLQVFDYVAGISDRHHRNVLVDKVTSQPWIHDNDGLGFGGSAKHPLEPDVSGTYLPRNGTFPRDVELSAETRAWLTAHVTGDDIRRLGAAYAAKDPEFAGPDTVEHMAQRLEHVLDTGSFRVRVSPWRDFQLNRLGDFFADHPTAQQVGTALGKVFSHH
jgi:hypothetical protein